jgi:hypothetical protein
MYSGDRLLKRTPKNILPDWGHHVAMPSPKFAKITLTIPREQRDWLRDHPEIDASRLLQQAITNQMQKVAKKT